MNTVSAPGKMLLGGEYAVLFGAEAVVTSVNRRAHARWLPKGPRESSVIVREVLRAARDPLSKRNIALSDAAWVSVQSSGFKIGKLKLGLGSSAAVAAGATGAIFEAHGLPIRDHQTEILQTSLAGHRAAQDGKGSGADVAAAVMGGTILYRMNEPPRRVSVRGIHIGVVFSGRSVSTQQMIEKIDIFKEREPNVYRAVMDELILCAGSMSQAFRADKPREIIESARAYGESMERLGRAAGVGIVAKEHRCAMTLAEEIGGAAKPSGAGGGDIAVAFFDSEAALHEFQIQCLRHELTPLDITADAEGLRVEPQ